MTEAYRQDKPWNARRARAELSILDIAYKLSDGLEGDKEPTENSLSHFVNADVWLSNSFWLKFCPRFKSKITILYSLSKLYNRAML